MYYVASYNAGADLAIVYWCTNTSNFLQGMFFQITEK